MFIIMYLKKIAAKEVMYQKYMSGCIYSDDSLLKMPL